MGILHKLQQAIAARLQADSWLTGVDIVTQADGDLDAMIKTKLGSIGIVCSIGMGKAGGSDPGALGLYFEDIIFVIEVQEFVLKNRGPAGTRKPVLDVCEQVAGLLHGYQMPDGPSFLVVDPGIVPVKPVTPATSAYAVAIATSDGVAMTPIE